MKGDNTHSLIIEYYLLPDRVIAFGARADWDRPEVVTWPIDRAELQAFAELHFDSGTSVREMVEFGMDEAWHSWDHLVSPAARWAAPGDVVCLIPHGVLHRLPLHALDLEGGPLIARNPVVYNSSASVLKLVRSRRGKSGDPQAPPGAMTRAAVFGDSLGDRRNARTEAVELARLLRTEPLLGEHVTRTAVIDSLRQADIVHIAGHGLFDAEDPLASGIRLADGALLTAADVFGLPPAQAALLALSGCETGVSQNRPGDELFGLTRAFLYNHVSTMAVSQWSVADASTAYLMGRFYTYLLGGAATSAHALQSAIRDTMNQPSWSSLYHWAPFILIGDWHWEGSNV